MSSTKQMMPARVFISHNKADKETAREIAIYLASEGANVWFDEWELSAGDSIVSEINAGLRDCTHFIVLWSSNAASSNWVRRELASTLNRAIEMGAPKILPILRDDTPLPELLRDILYIRFRSGSEAERSEIVRAVMGNGPTNTFIRAVVRKYQEIMSTPRSDNSAIPWAYCPKCGSEKLWEGSYADDREVYWIYGCSECGWNVQ